MNKFLKMKRKSLFLSVNNYTGFYIFLSALALFLGGLIYILFRTSEPVFFKWISDTQSGKWFNIIRYSFLPLNSILENWIVYSLPNGLWAFSYALLITGIWSGNKSWIRYCWMASIPLLVLSYEFLQLTDIIPGIFCIQDLLLGTAGFLTGIIIGIKTIKPNHHEKTSE